MKNLHLEHPEDAIFNYGKNGAHEVLKFFLERGSKYSLKWDGSPAIVWGTNPENGKFFVGTKSVFNKVKVKVNYSHEDIDLNHEGEVAQILHKCFDYLPRVKFIVQGDYIGEGGKKKYCPNTITYKFQNIINEKIIVAPHTIYKGSTLKDCEINLRDEFLYALKFCYQKDCRFLNDHAHVTHESFRVQLLCNLANLLIPYIEFPNFKEGAELKKVINRYIREGKRLSSKNLSQETGYSKKLFLFYKLLMLIKTITMKHIHPSERVSCFIGNKRSSHEGYVMVNKYGRYKLVNRLKFSYANFNSQKGWKK